MPDLQDAISLLEKGNAREASILLKALAAEMPGYATARVLLARAYEGLGEWNGALRAWREALHIVPNSPVIRRGLERAARKAASRAPMEELPELPSMSVSAPFSGDVAVAVLEETDQPPAEAQEAERGATDEDAADLEPADLEPEEVDDSEPPAEETKIRHEEADIPRAEAEISPDEPGSPTPEDEDLDRLIAELESARIVPRPDFESVPEPELEDDIEDVVSVTLARIYASQGQYDEAARVYELLADQQPDNEQEFMARAAEMRSMASDD